MNRAFLKELGIVDSEIVKQILDEHQGVVLDLKDKVVTAQGDLKSAQTDLKTAQTDLKTANATLLSLQNTTSKSNPDGKDWETEYNTLLQSLQDKDGKTWQEKFEALTGEFDTYKQTIAEEKVKGEKQTVLRNHLQSDGANAKLIDLLELKFDLNNIEVADGKIKDWEKVSAPIKEQYADVFAVTEQKNFEPGKPPTGQNGNDYKTRLENARKSGNTQEAVKIKTEAATEGVYLI